MKNKYPDAKGRFGMYGGRYVPETLMGPVLELERAYLKMKGDRNFQHELNDLLEKYVGRPTPLTFASRLTKKLGGAKIYLKREDLAHTGAHKINNTIGQALLAKRMGKKRLIAETGAGQHGVAVATVAALFDMECVVYMGTKDMERQALNVYRMKLLGADVRPVHAGTKTLKDAINEAMRDWVTNVNSSYYLLGSVLGPHPYPMMVRDFQSVIGKEARRQIFEAEGCLPNLLIACVGGGSNAMGLFHEFLSDEYVSMLGVEAGGEGVDTGRHASRFSGGLPGVFHGTLTYLLQNKDGLICETSSVSAGLDYPAVGPEHSLLNEIKRAKYVSVTDKEALDAFKMLSCTEGIIPALESAHAIAEAIKVAPKLSENDIIIINLSGRGDKDIEAVRNIFREEI